MEVEFISYNREAVRHVVADFCNGAARGIGIQLVLIERVRKIQRAVMRGNVSVLIGCADYKLRRQGVFNYVVLVFKRSGYRIRAGCNCAVFDIRVALARINLFNAFGKHACNFYAMRLAVVVIGFVFEGQPCPEFAARPLSFVNGKRCRQNFGFIALTRKSCLRVIRARVRALVVFVSYGNAFGKSTAGLERLLLSVIGYGFICKIYARNLLSGILILAAVGVDKSAFFSGAVSAAVASAGGKAESTKYSN